MKYLRNKYIVLEISYYLVCLFSILFCTFLYVPSNVLNYFFVGLIVGIIGIFIFVLPKYINHILAAIFHCAFVLYILGQYCYHQAFFSYIRLSSAFSLYQELWMAKDSAASFISWKEYVILFGTILMHLFFFALQIYNRKQFSYRSTWKVRLIGVVFLFQSLISLGLYHVVITQRLNHATDTKNLYLSEEMIYERITQPTIFVSKFGLYSFLYRDFQTMISPVNQLYREEEITDFLNQGLKHKDNLYTGMFQGKNVMFVQAESFNRAALDPDLTPTIYKMYKEGISIESFNTPSLPGSTSDTEFMANTSLIPSSDKASACYAYDQNFFPITLPKLFKEYGYSVDAFHNNYQLYYNRENIFRNFGYDHFYDCTNLGLQDTSTDFQVSENLKYFYDQLDTPWMAYWITYSGHQPYLYDSVGVNESDVKRILEKYPSLSEEYVSYFAKNMDLDKALQNIMDVLKTTNKLDDVVFVFFGDHNAKGLSFLPDSAFFEMTQLPINPEKMYYQNTDLFFYCSDPKIQSVQVKKLGTAIDILPTVANLWGMSIDETKVIGHDLFDEQYKGFYFSQWDTYKTSNWEYDLDTLELKVENNYPILQAQNELSYYFEQKEISKQILDMDYFAEKDKRVTPKSNEEIEEIRVW